MEILRLRAVVAFVELNPLEFVKVRLVIHFRFNDRVIVICEFTEREVGIARSVAAHGAFITILTRWYWFLHSWKTPHKGGVMKK